MVCTCEYDQEYDKVVNPPRKIVLRMAEDYPPGTPQSTPCKLWQGAVDDGGYGVVYNPETKSNVGVTRLTWMLERGPIPPGHMICHRCDNPPCYDIDHLFLGTALDNVHDMLSKGRNVTHGKLAETDILAINLALLAGQTQSAIASQYGVSQPAIHYWAKQLGLAGDGSNWVRLTDEQRNEIRNRYRAGGVSQYQLAAEYGVSQRTINVVLRSK